MATVMEPKGTDLGGTARSAARTDTARGRSPWVTSLFVVLAALIGFGIGWLAFRDSGVDVPSDVSELIDGYELAWVNSDGDAAVAAMTDGGAHISSFTGPSGVSGDRLANMVNGLADFSVENEEYVGVFGDTPYLVVIAGTVDNQDGYSVFRIVDQGGELKIVTHTWYIDGSTPGT